MRIADICAPYKGRGEITDLDSVQGIFLVNIFRTNLMKLIYKEQYDVIDIGARKHKKIWNSIFIVNSSIHDVLSRKSKSPVDIIVLDYKQMFDSECFFQYMNDLHEAGVYDNIFPLIYEANRENMVAVNTHHSISKRDELKK